MNSTNFQKGFINFLVISGILIIILTTSVVFYKKSLNFPSNLQISTPTSIPLPISSPTIHKTEEVTSTQTPSKIPQYPQSPSPTSISQNVFSIAIKGDNNCVSQTEQALNLLKEKANFITLS